MKIPAQSTHHPSRNNKRHVGLESSPPLAPQQQQTIEPNPPANGLTIQASVEPRKWPRACIPQQATTGQQVRPGSRQQARLGKVHARPSLDSILPELTPVSGGVDHIMGGAPIASKHFKYIDIP